MPTTIKRRRHVTKGRMKYEVQATMSVLLPVDSRTLDDELRHFCLTVRRVMLHDVALAEYDRGMIVPEADREPGTAEF